MGRSLWRAEQIPHGGRKAKSFWSTLGNWLLVRTWRILEQVWPVDPWKPNDLFRSLGGENCPCTKEGVQHTLLMSLALSSRLSDGGGQNGPRFMRKPDPTATNLKGGALEKWIHRLCLLDRISDFFMEAWRNLFTPPTIQGKQKVLSVWNRSPPDTKSTGVSWSAELSAKLLLVSLF